MSRKPGNYEDIDDDILRLRLENKTAKQIAASTGRSYYFVRWRLDVSDIDQQALEIFRSSVKRSQAVRLSQANRPVIK